MGTSPHRNDDRTLVVYAAACRALAAARTTDEVKKIRDQGAMLRAYAKQAKNKQLEMDAVEIRIRAERRVGELVTQQKQTVGLNRGAEANPRGRGAKVVRDKNGPTQPTLADAGIDKHLADRARKLAAVPEKKFEHLVTTWRDRTERDGERVTADVLRADKMHVHHSSETPEHYTPASFLDAVTTVFGDIPDLDPCSNPAPFNVPARQHYTVSQNGLAQPWHGRVFMNPPYGRDIQQWIQKARHEWTEQHIVGLIALLPSRTDTEWFDQLTADTDDAVVCFLRGRLTFIGNDDAAPFPSMAVYFGPHHDAFARVFGALGSLWIRPGTPAEWFVNHE